jgi:hypothetical protein
MYKTLIKIRSAVLVFLTHQMALPILKLARRPEVFPYTAAQLAQFKSQTLGNELYHFLQHKNLQLLPYYARHDIKHILLGYDTTDEGEVCLQCFMLGNGHLSFPVGATVLFGLCTMPEYYTHFWQAFKRGRRANCIKNWPWFSILHCNLQQLKNNIFNATANQ